MNLWTKLKVALAVEGVYQDRAFIDQTVHLDRNHYFRCTFNRCTIRFAGRGSMSAIDCDFANSTFLFAGRAASTIQFLEAIGYTLTPPPGITAKENQ